MKEIADALSEYARLRRSGIGSAVASEKAGMNFTGDDSVQWLRIIESVELHASNVAVDATISISQAHRRALADGFSN